jgi:thiamine-monophosphate kinase
MELKESFILETWLKSLAQDTHGALGLLDDAALLHLPEDVELVITTDMAQEGIHFLPTQRGGLVASKVLGANLSDLAAMGATPYCYQLALGLTDNQYAAWMDAFVVTLADMQRTHGIGLLGGDTIRGCAALTISITAFGIVPRGRALMRTTAKVGDTVYMTGTLGDGALGLAFLQHKMLDIDESYSQFLQHRYWHPTPRLHTGQALRGIASACMDISDGLLVDCGKLCAASHVGAVIDYARLPLSSAARWAKEHMPTLFAECISGGDDYELLFTAPPEKEEAVMQVATLSKTPITAIGQIIEGDKVTLVEGTTPLILPYIGYEH